MTAVKMDAFGLPESASALGNTIINTANHIGFAVQRSAALLRSLHFQLLNSSTDAISIPDVMTLVELALQALPDSDGDIFNVLDKCEVDISRAFRAAHHQQQAMSALLDAFEVVACEGSTLDELDKTANTVYGIANILPDGQRHWDVFCSVLSKRELSLELMAMDTGMPVVKVNTPATLKRSRQVQRKTAAFVAAVQEENAARVRESVGT